MSKSVGNFITIRDFLKKYDMNVLRWITLSHHYRSPVDYNDELAGLAMKQLDDLNRFIYKLETVAGSHFIKENANGYIPRPLKFEEALHDDLNTPQLIGFLFEDYIANLNPTLWDTQPEQARLTANWLRSFFEELGISLKSPKISEKAQQLAQETSILPL